MPALTLDDLPRSFSHQLRTGRELVQASQRAPEEERWSTACPPLDRLLAGGLLRGTMIELCGRRSSGRFSLVVAALAATTQAGEAAALVDLGDGLDPGMAAACGVELERLLWVRPRRMKEALFAAETILASGMPLLVLDLGLPPLGGGRGMEASWLRLARTAQAHRAALLVSSPYRVSGTAARLVIEARPARHVWQGQGKLPRLLGGLTVQLELVKGPRQQQGRVEDLPLRSPSTTSTGPTSTGLGIPTLATLPPSADASKPRRAVA
jgi:hypothetical protein